MVIGSNKVYPLINPKKQSSKKDYKNSGNLHFPRLEVVKSYSFLEYVKGGTDINFTVAIDFTGMYVLLTGVGISKNHAFLLRLI